MITKLCLYCPVEKRAVCTIEGPAGKRCKKDHMIRDMEMAEEDPEARRQLLAESKTGRESTCPWCGNSLAVVADGADIEKAAITPLVLPLGTFMFPEGK